MTSGTGLARYSGTHFVKWDNWKTGGRWFECTIIERMSDRRYQVLVHDGAVGYFYGKDLTALGSTPSLLDMVIAYWDGRAYAFKGKVTAEKSLSGEFWVEFDDGDEAWIPSRDVHKLESL